MAVPVWLAPVVIGGAILLVGRKVWAAIKKPAPPPIPKPKPGPKPGPKPKPKGNGVRPYVRNPTEGQIVKNLVKRIEENNGKMPLSTLPELEAVRKQAGAAPVNRGYRDRDPKQTPEDWITNLAYWEAYPFGWVKIPNPEDPYAGAWKRIRDDVLARLGEAGLL